MVLIFIGLLISFYSLANGRLFPSYGSVNVQYDCVTAAGSGLCVPLADCELYRSGAIRQSDLFSCSSGTDVYCCPLTISFPKTFVNPPIPSQYTATAKICNTTLPHRYKKDCLESRPCTSSAGSGSCQRLSNCELYLKIAIPYSKLSRCLFARGIEVVCCPTTVQSSKVTGKIPIVGITPITQTYTRRNNPTIERPKPKVSPIIPITGQSAGTPPQIPLNLCDTSFKHQRNRSYGDKRQICYENSPCFSLAGSGSCVALENCESYRNNEISYSNLSRCLFARGIEVVCCPPITKTKSLEIRPPSVIESQFPSKLPDPEIPPSVPKSSTTQSKESSSPSPSKWCNIVNGNGIGNCYEGSPCTSASGNGICKQYFKCETVHVRPPTNFRCSSIGTVEVFCCPTTTRSSPWSQTQKTPSQPHRNQYDLTTRPTGLSVAASGGRCFIGTCKNAEFCQPLLDKKVNFYDLQNCGGHRFICCPVSSSQAVAVPVQPIIRSTEGRSCSLTSGSGICTVLNKCQSFLMGAVKNAALKPCDPTMKHIVCCPQITNTSEKLSHTTRRTVVTSKPEVRRSRKACEIYKTKNPSRLQTHNREERQAQAGEFPHVGIMLGPKEDDASKLIAYCGVALVSQRFALTAAQCIHGLNPSDIVVNFGSVDLNPTTYVQVKVKNIMINDQNNPSEDYHDLAILEFLTNVPLSQLVHPACLHVDVEDLPRNTMLQVNGWSSNNPSDDYRYPFLFNSIVYTFPLLSCNFTHIEDVGVSRRYPTGLNQGHYCARHAANGECDGNPGFPLVLDTNGQFEIVGIMSKQFGCSSSAPSMYTRVAYYIDWIEKIVWPTPSRG